MKAFGNKKIITEREWAPDTRVGTGRGRGLPNRNTEGTTCWHWLCRLRQGGCGRGEVQKGEGGQWVGVEGTDCSSKKIVYLSTPWWEDTFGLRSGSQQMPAGIT